ncbi:MAG: DUF4258 domain-containing protein [Ginsengibacter sp.]
MKGKYAKLIGIIVLAILAIIIGKDRSSKTSAGEELFRDTQHLILTKHVKCRMDCRHITEQEIKEVIHDGTVNAAKSGLGARGDPSYALEGFSSEHQHIRVVVAPENDGLVVITCIDLDREWPCNCY